MREKVARWAEANPKFVALDRAECFKMVFLSRPLGTPAPVLGLGVLPPILLG